MIEILIADDHAIFREGVRSLLEVKNDLRIVGEAGRGREALQMCRELKPDVILLDLDLPDIDGLEVTRRIGEEGLKTKIIIMTMHTNEEFAVRLFQAGAAAFVPKYSSSRILPNIIRSVMEGDTFLPEEMKELVMSRLIGSKKTGAELLSDREMQVFKSIVEGLSIKEIADKFGISPKTVETHKSRFMEKLGLKTTADIFKTAIRMGLIKNY